MKNEIIFSTDSDKKVRLDKYLSKSLKDMSRSHIQALIENENIKLNGHKTKNSYLLTNNDRISIDLPENTEVKIEAEDIPLDIYYEDDDIIVVNKPKGMVVHPSFGHTSGTLVNALMFHCQDSLSGINGKLRPGIVHRIDKDTSGLLIACKNDKAHLSLALQLSRHSLKREYIALCYGRFKEAVFTVDAPIGRSKKERKMMAVVSPDKGRRAVTHVTTLKSFRLKKGSLSQDLSLIKCTLETGRTHQIRVHMKYIGHPLAGDEIYGKNKDPFKGQGQYLHAALLGFVHPSLAKEMIFEAPLPKYFKDTLDKLSEVI